MSQLQKFINRVRTLRYAYRTVFVPGPMTDKVLLDLAKFCRAKSTPAVVSPTTQTIDPVATGIAIGRLEVWLRITQNIHMSDTDLYKLVDSETNGTDYD